MKNQDSWKRRLSKPAESFSKRKACFWMLFAWTTIYLSGVLIAPLSPGATQWWYMGTTVAVWVCRAIENKALSE